MALNAHPPQTFDLRRTQPHTRANTLSRLQNKGAGVERAGEGSMQGKDDMTFRISGTMCFKKLQKTPRAINNTVGTTPSTALKRA